MGTDYINFGLQIFKLIIDHKPLGPEHQHLTFIEIEIQKIVLTILSTLFAGPKPEHSEVPKIWPFILATNLQFKSVSNKFHGLFNHFHTCHKKLINNTYKEYGHKLQCCTTSSSQLLMNQMMAVVDHMEQ